MGVDERRQQLIGVALELFSTRSPDEVSIDEIAAAAGISRPLVYHYFPGKQSLYEAALRRAADELAGSFREPHEGDTWICRREVSIRLPYDKVILTSSEGVPLLGARDCAAVQGQARLTKGPRRLRRHPALLDPTQRAWLAAALARVHPGHRWS